MSLRAPLGRVLGLGTAKDGTDHWWGQRISAVALVLLGLWFAVSLVVLPSLEHHIAVEFIGTPLNSVLLSLLCVTTAYHSYLGVQVVVEDYVHAAGLRITSLILSRFAHVFVAVVSVYAILKIGLAA
ncbi:MAG: succinate dehydrogenase, hydrophobic membrane anchor protein [Gammaproteobacteria bacterium]|jgi:succinate dehydrogenase / fumarate reductase membrane anchor subunit|nr:succinate dehydrogenase, hydrophobic membrane anchor protein [Gammaproteobacteria bacterium]MDH3751275.1 succinate dehydrogenase, hydrophobic membrane anchor protein [Gammaproteobacteria bacterium]MDH3806236.1 succinate dehydrogenase, hydrophobic membrane anchor protein [Gammaproteobacteria bacterium]